MNPEQPVLSVQQPEPAAPEPTPIISAQPVMPSIPTDMTNAYTPSAPASKKNPAKMIIFIVIALMVIGVGAYAIQQIAFSKKVDTAVKTLDDAGRKSAITSLVADLEEYYNQKGYYPSYEQVNDASFRAKNLTRFDKAFSSSKEGLTLSSSSSSSSYAYIVSPTGCDNTKTDCLSYTVSVTTSTGEYKKNSLN